ncbi:MAG TPA: hypothetical protein VLG27_02085 [Candidatus Saccharimonadia bacterium]|nr:hypothetical protein [Candidatus Saccharimonadia bacterium]
MLRSHSIIWRDFDSGWYGRWAGKLKQTPAGRGNFALRANKFWQNAVMAQMLDERGKLKPGSSGIGFGVGKERLPALFASLGAHVQATDQDFTKANAKRWTNDQLAEGVFSLNEDGICPPKRFNELVGFSAVDMTKIPKAHHGKYDFLWSNCALGHLGSIPKGLSFIENSLDCLKPSGVAVHTTEVNVLSDDETVKTGNTVIFRPQDIYKLCVKLTQKGYLCSPLRLSNGRQPEDLAVSLDPAWGTDCTRILVDGHLATQVVLQIRKPAKPLSNRRKRIEAIRHGRAYKHSLRVQAKMPKTSPAIKWLLTTQAVGYDQLKLTPLKTTVKTKADKLPEAVMLPYRNDSAVALTGSPSLFRAKPIVLGTEHPINRNSQLAGKSWSSPNRPSLKLYQKRGSSWQAVEYVKPGDNFAMRIGLETRSKTRPHQEDFTLIQEAGGVVPNAEITVAFE